MASVTRRIRKQVVLNTLRRLAPKIPVWAMLSGVRSGRLRMAEFMINNELVADFCEQGKIAMRQAGVKVEE